MARPTCMLRSVQLPKFALPLFSLRCRPLLAFNPRRHFSHHESGQADRTTRVADTAPPSTDVLRYRLFEQLQLESFDETELKRAHAALSNSLALPPASAGELKSTANSSSGSGIIPPHQACTANALAAHETLTALQIRHSASDYPAFAASMRALGERRDRRLLPLAAGFLATGLSLGIVTPVLPLLVNQIGLPPQEFGVVVAAFGLARLLGNVPAAALVDRFGKKRVLVWGQCLMAVGLGCVGLAVYPALGGSTWLIGCRLLGGFGVSAFVGGAYMLVADFSTNLNRARSMAPVTASFQAGTALGPAIGGAAVEVLGIAPTYVLVGSLFGAIAAFNHRYLSEGVPVARPAPGAAEPPLGPLLSTSFSKAFVSWRALLENDAIKNVCALNACYWLAFAGGQWVVLPLFLVQTLGLGAGQMGLSFAFSSAISVLSSAPAAWLADKSGNVPTLLLGGALVSLSMMALPLAANFNELLLVLLPLSAGSTILGAVPTAMINGLVTTNRSQALALLRTSADFGMLVGAVGSGALCTLTSLAIGLQANGCFLLGAIVWYAARSLWRSKKSVTL